MHNTRPAHRRYHSTIAAQNGFPSSKLWSTSRVHPSADEHRAVPSRAEPATICIQIRLSTLSCGRAATNKTAVVPTARRSFSTRERRRLKWRLRVFFFFCFLLFAFFEGAVKESHTRTHTTEKRGQGDAAAALTPRGSAAEVAGSGEETAATVDG